MKYGNCATRLLLQTIPVLAEGHFLNLFVAMAAYFGRAEAQNHLASSRCGTGRIGANDVARDANLVLKHLRELLNDVPGAYLDAKVVEMEDNGLSEEWDWRLFLASRTKEHLDLIFSAPVTDFVAEVFPEREPNCKYARSLQKWRVDFVCIHGTSGTGVRLHPHLHSKIEVMQGRLADWRQAAPPLGGGAIVEKEDAGAAKNEEGAGGGGGREKGGRSWSHCGEGGGGGTWWQGGWSINASACWMSDCREKGADDREAGGRWWSDGDREAGGRWWSDGGGTGWQGWQGGRRASWTRRKWGDCGEEASGRATAAAAGGGHASNGGGGGLLSTGQRSKRYRS